MTNGSDSSLGDFRGSRETVVLSVPPRPTLETFSGAFARLALEASMQPLEDVLIDMAGLTFVHPVELCLLRQLTAEAARLSKSVSLNLPIDPDVASYLRRMDTFGNVPTNVQVPPGGIHRRNDLRDRLIETFPISSKTGVDRLAEAVNTVAAARIEVPQSLRVGLVSAITEAAANVIDHARALLNNQHFRGRGFGLLARRVVGVVVAWGDVRRSGCR